MWILIIVIVILITIYTKYQSNGLPGPWGLPILGSLLSLDPKCPHKSLTLLARRYGRKYGLFTLRLGHVRTVVITDPKLIRQALAMDEFSGRAPLYLTHGIMHGYGLICSEGELWKEQRRFATSCLKSLGMVRLGEKRQVLAIKLQDAARLCVTMLSDEVAASPEGSVDTLKTLQHTLGNMVNSIVFGREYAPDDPTWKWLQHLQEEGTKLIGVAGPLNFLPWLRFVPHYKRTIKFLLDGKEKTHDIYRDILRSNIPGDNVATAYLAEMAKRSPEAPGSFSEAQCLHALADLFGAGMDTTLGTLRWLLIFLASHPEAQARVQDELDAVVMSRDGQGLELKDQSECPYIEAAIAETQRLRSIVPVGIPHGATQDCELAGFNIARGTMIIPLQWAVHTDPEIWGPNSLEFYPERFLNNEGRVSRPDYFIPFQTGKRTCLGEELGRMLLFVFGSTILQKFSLSPPEGVDIEDILEGECGITLNPKPHQLVLKIRQ